MHAAFGSTKTVLALLLALGLALALALTLSPVGGSGSTGDLPTVTKHYKPVPYSTGNKVSPKSANA